MKLLLVLFAVASVRVRAFDDVWMEMLSHQIMEAEATYGYLADKKIPALAQDLGLTTLVDQVTKAKLVDTLSGAGPFTVFGPSNDGFKKVPPFVLNNVTVMAKILKYHVAAKKVLSSDLKNDLLIETVQGSSIRINIYKNNSVITASGRQVINPDNEASNGVIHVVSAVLIPPPKTLANIVSKCPLFSILLEAVTKAGLAETLAGDGPFTLFAPTNLAFRKIPKYCLDKLLANIPLLKKVLLYHVVPSTQYSLGLSCGEELKTAEGRCLKIRKFGAYVMVNYAHAIALDVTASNGVMQVINSVLFPREMVDFCPEVARDYVDEPIKQLPFF